MLGQQALKDGEGLGSPQGHRAGHLAAPLQRQSVLGGTEWINLVEAETWWTEIVGD